MFHHATENLPAIGLRKRIGYYALHFLTWLVCASCYRYRSWGVRRVPDTGPVLLVSNHQSFLDPILIGLAFHWRPFHSLARASLWESRIMAPLYNLLNAIPVSRGQSDPRAMRLCIEALKGQRTLLLFPEGSRTLDGAVQPFERGMLLLIRRAPAWVVPVAIEGAQHAWPRQSKLPRLRGHIGVEFGQPIPARQLVDQPPDDALEQLRTTIESMRTEVGRKLRGEPAQPA